MGADNAHSRKLRTPMTWRRHVTRVDVDRHRDTRFNACIATHAGSEPLNFDCVTHARCPLARARGVAVMMAPAAGAR